MRNARAALRGAFSVNLRSLAPVRGVITAVPLVVVFSVGLLLFSPRIAVSMAIGANLIAIVSLVGAPKLPLHLALVDAVGLGIAAVAGTLTAQHPLVHAAVLLGLTFLAGMAVGFGQTQGVVGSQAIVAFVVLGHYAGGFTQGVHTGLFVLLGSLVEVLALVVLRFPGTLRFQRSRLAQALEALARYATSEPEASALGALAAIDEAQRVLAPSSLFGRGDVRDLRGIVVQLRQSRIELTSLAGLRLRLTGSDASLALVALDNALRTYAESLLEVATSIRQRHPLPASGTAGPLRQQSELFRRVATDEHLSTESRLLLEQCASHVEALRRQLQSCLKIALDESQVNNGRAWRVDLAVSGLEFAVVRNVADNFISNLRRDSTVFRHAVRLSLAVTFSYLLATWLALPRGYWVPFAVGVILKPDYSTLLKRGVSRVIGTAVGASLAALLVSELHPSTGLTALLVAVVATCAYSTWSASFAVSIGLVTSLVLIMLSTSVHDSVMTAGDRLVDVTLGAIIAAVAYLVWPTSPENDVLASELSLTHSLATYLETVAGGFGGGEVAPAAISAASRQAHLAYGRCEAAIGRSLDEPSATRTDPTIGGALLGGALRIIRATHALRFADRLVNVTASSPELVATCSALVEALRGGPATAVLTSVERLTDAWEHDDQRAGLLLTIEELANAVLTTSRLVAEAPTSP